MIANVVAVVNDEFANKVVEEVSKTSTDEKQTLSAQVLKAIVDTEPDKIESISDENDLAAFLENKRAGERVTVTTRRDNRVLEYEIELQAPPSP